MSEKEKALLEIDARNRLQNYLGLIAQSGNITFDDYLQLVEETRMPIAVFSLVAHNGQEAPTSTDRLFNYRKRGSKFTALNSFNGAVLNTSLISMSRRHAFGPINKKLLSLSNLGIKGAVASHNPDQQNLFYMLDKCENSISNNYQLGNTSNVLVGDVPRVTNLAILATEDCVKHHEILDGFISVSGELIEDLLEKTA